MLSLKGKGYWLIIAILIINLALWLGSKYYYQDSFASIFKYLAKINSLTGTLLMAFTLILSTRLKLLEYLFGGLDKVYKAHHMMGRWSFTLLVLHPIFLSLIRFPDPQLMAEFWLPSFIDNYYIGHSVGLLTLGLFFVLLYLTISKTLKYELWLRTHTLFGWLFALGIIHIILVNADIAKYPIFGIWYYSWLIAGVLSYLWISLFSKAFGSKYQYQISHKEVIGSVSEFTFSPVNRALSYRPGQFLYTRFLTEDLKNETHPYSIASYSEDGTFRMGIKALGDHTTIVQKCEVGTQVEFKGPFGNLSEKVLLENNKKVVLIGGGIGITPMISIWEYILKTKKRTAQLIYVTSFVEDASFDNDIHKLINQYGIGDSDYWLYLDGKKDFFNIEKLKNHIGTLDNTVYLICGPKKMMDALVTGLKEAGVSNSSIVIEDFDFGIGKKNWFLHIRKLIGILK